MSSPLPTNFSTTPTIKLSKRSACDRCRGQKLRCPPREAGQESCDRCLRLGAQCVTNYSTVSTKGSNQVARRQSRGNNSSNGTPAAKLNRRPGLLPNVDLRPKRPEVSPVLASQELFPSSTQTPLPTPPSSLSLTSSTINEMGKWSLVSHGRSGETNFSSFSPSDSVSFSFTDSNLDLLSSEALSVLDNANCEDVVGGISFSPEDMNGFLSSPEMGDIASTQSTSDSEQLRIPSNISDIYFPTPIEFDQQLLRLGLDLSERLHRYVVTKCRPWDSANGDISSSSSLPENSVATNFGTNAMNMDQNQDTSANCNYFGDALRHTSEFIAIIQSYGVGHRTSQSSSSKPSLSIVVALNVLSAYLQIIAIYDHLFGRLYEQSCSASAQAAFDPGFIPELQTLPGLQLAGFSVNQGNLQTKILIQAILHQFEMIEKILGLPVEFRVSDRNDLYEEGLLEDERARRLMKAAMADGRHWSQVPMDGSREGCELREMASLKDHIKRVRRLLDTGCP